MSDSTTLEESSPHRRKQRRRILEALAEVVQSEGVHAFSMQQVADQAGLSHRTLYRYFPTRQDLLDGLVTHYEGYVHDPEIDNLEGLLPHMALLFGRFERYPNESAVGAIGALVMGRQFSTRARRDALVFEFVEQLRDPESSVSAREAGAIIRYLANSLCWLVLRRQLGLSQDESVRAVQWALETLIAEIKKGNGPGKA
ncbi:MAG: TetR/AcrR family transcriptional regulator [Bradymonadaceae bacterium]|nr:TetR/AcrR family transcriptional regulator [Lujinxingiaceae bacterium]